MTAKIAAFGAMLQRKLSRDHDGVPEETSSIHRRFSISSATLPTNNDGHDGSKSVADHYVGEPVSFKFNLDKKRRSKRARMIRSVGRP